MTRAQDQPAQSQGLHQNWVEYRCARGIRWTHPYWGEIANGVVSADTTKQYEGWLRIQIGNLDQRITLVSRSRHFGGLQWYFVCPVKNRLVSVLWKAPGANQFRSRQAWGRQVAYQSQFNDATYPAHNGQAKIKARLIGDNDPDNGICRRSQNGCGGLPTVGLKS